MRKNKNNTKMPAKRSVEAISLRNFRSTTFDHKAAERDGATNEFRDLLNEAWEDMSEEN